MTMQALLLSMLVTSAPAMALEMASHLAEFELIGTELTVYSEQGERIAGQGLIGAEIDVPGLGTLRIDGAWHDESSRFGDIWLYRLQARLPGMDGFRPLCEPDGGGDDRAVLFPGDFDERMRYRADDTTFSLSCISGVQAKCLRWGYVPWRKAPLSGVLLREHFDACIRMARADYCGDDQPTTRDGTRIDIYDRVGVQQPEIGPDAMPFEAGWAAQGAVCVHHPRIAEHLDLNALARDCPRLASQPLGSACDEDTAAAHGAIVFNRSAGASRP